MKDYFTRERIFFWIVTLLCLTVISYFCLAFFLGVITAYLYEPIMNKMESKLKIKRQINKIMLACVLMCVTFLAIIVPLFAILKQGAHELQLLFSNIHPATNGKDLLYTYASYIANLLQSFGIEYTAHDLLVKSMEILQSLSRILFTNLGHALSSTPLFILKSSIFLLTWFFFLLNGKNYRNMILNGLIPAQWEAEKNLISQTFTSVLRALVVANLAVACIQALLVTGVLFVFSVPKFALLGMISLFLAFMPGGTAPIMIGAAAWCYFASHRLAAAIGILIFACIVGVIDNILRPFFMKGSGEIHFFWMFLSLIGGMGSFGLAGVLIGPFFFALFKAANEAFINKQSL